MVQAAVYILLHGRAYTRGFSVSGATLSIQTSFCFFPGKEIRKVTPLMFGILASLACPEAIPEAWAGHPHKTQVYEAFLSGAGHPGVEAGAELEGWLRIQPHL